MIFDPLTNFAWKGFPHFLLTNFLEFMKVFLIFPKGYNFLTQLNSYQYFLCRNQQNKIQISSKEKAGHKPLSKRQAKSTTRGTTVLQTFVSEAQGEDS